jgi:uncharacterized protein YrrD
MYRTSSVLALGLFIGLAPAALHAQQDTQQQQIQQQDTQQQQIQQQDTQQQTQQQVTQQQPEQRSAGLLSAEEGSLMVDTMIGADVYSTRDDDETVGSIDDVVITLDGQVLGVIIGVGGWLGVGQRDVLVPMNDLGLVARDGDLRLVMQRTREELEDEPEFRHVEGQRRVQTGVITAQQDPALMQADQELQRAELAVQDGDGQQARERLQQAHQQLEQAHQQAHGDQQGALQQSNDSLQQADQAIQNDDAQQAQQSIQRAREQLQIAMQNVQQQGTVQQGTVQQGTAQPARRDGQIVFQDENSIMASTMIGTDVQVGSLEDNEDLGPIRDVIISMDGMVQGVVVGVGGFLGFGEKDVIVGMDKLDIQRTGDDQVRVSVMQTREELEAAEAFQRPQLQ